MTTTSSRTAQVALATTGVELNYLNLMFDQQRMLMVKYHDLEEKNGSPVIDLEDEGYLSDRRVQARIHELFGYLVRELSEAMQELKNKPWKKTVIAADVEAFREEMGDSMHFMVEMLITAGMTPKDLYDAFHRTQIKNVNRQNGDY